MYTGYRFLKTYLADIFSIVCSLPINFVTGGFQGAKF